MTWYTIRLDLARSDAFPEGSAARCYLLRAPLDERGTIDDRAVRAHPDHATVLRSWPDEAERRGYLLHDAAGWRFSYAPGEADDEPIFHLETHPIALGAYLTVREQDGEDLCFKVTRCDEVSFQPEDDAMTGTMLAVLDDVDNGAGFIRTMVALAERRDSRLIIYLLTPGPLAAPDLAPFGVLYLPDQMLQADSEEQVAKLRATLHDATIEVDVRGLFDDVAWLAGDVRRARPIADLAVVGAHETWAIPYLYRRVTEMLALASGGPLLILPPGRSLSPVSHAVLAWKSCPEAVRALHDLMPLLEAGARVDVVSCGDRPAKDDDARGHATVTAYLEQSGFEVGSVWLERRYDVAEQLQTYALEVGADLLAAGAFAHSRLHELVFGGVTAGLIRETRVPVLLSR